MANFAVMIHSLSSQLLENAVAELSKLPGIGRKTALRLALHLLRQEEGVAVALGESVMRMRREICYCSRCHNISESPVCPICGDARRDQKTICVVENIKDVLTVESTGVHRGVYHVLGGLISPIEGVGPADIEIESLCARVEEEGTQEVILALSPTMEGDTTSFYIYRRLEPCGVKISMLARGLSIGNELEYTDELTLGRSIQNRIPFKN